MSLELTDLISMPLKGVLCPYCGSYHYAKKQKIPIFLTDFNEENVVTMYCENIHKSCRERYPYRFYVEKTEEDSYMLHYQIANLCVFRRGAVNASKLSGFSITEHNEFGKGKTSRLELKVSQTLLEEHVITRFQSSCQNCEVIKNCEVSGYLKEKPNYIKYPLYIGFEFDTEVQKTINFKEVNIMEGRNKRSLMEQLYEVSPKENFDILKGWVAKYKSTLQWAVPVVCIYGGYRILKHSSLNVDNIDKECNELLGFDLPLLKDKKELKKLVTLGVLAAGIYGFIKAVHSVDKKVGDVGIDDVEESLSKISDYRKKYDWIREETEPLLPVAVSVLVVYIMTQKPKWFEDAKEKIIAFTGERLDTVKVYAEMVELFITSKLHIDINDEDKKKNMRFFFLAAIIGISILLYGKSVMGKKADLEPGEEKNTVAEKMAPLVEQLMEIMKKLLPGAFAGFVTFLVAKKVVKPDETSEEEVSAVDVEYTEVESSVEE